MAAFIVATVRISDPGPFGAYAKDIAGLSESFGGESVLKGPVSEILEGEGAIGERVVVTRFPDADSARAYIRSETYQSARALREGAADVTMRLIEA